MRAVLLLTVLVGVGAKAENVQLPSLSAFESVAKSVGQHTAWDWVPLQERIAHCVGCSEEPAFRRLLASFQGEAKEFPDRAGRAFAARMCALALVAYSADPEQEDWRGILNEWCPESVLLGRRGLFATARAEPGDRSAIVAQSFAEVSCGDPVAAGSPCDVFRNRGAAELRKAVAKNPLKLVAILWTDRVRAEGTPAAAKELESALMGSGNTWFGAPRADSPRSLKVLRAEVARLDESTPRRRFERYWALVSLAAGYEAAGQKAEAVAVWSQAGAALRSIEQDAVSPAVSLALMSDELSRAFSRMKRGEDSSEARARANKWFARAVRDEEGFKVAILCDEERPCVGDLRELLRRPKEWSWVDERRIQARAREIVEASCGAPGDVCEEAKAYLVTCGAKLDRDARPDACW